MLTYFRIRRYVNGDARISTWEVSTKIGTTDCSRSSRFNCCEGHLGERRVLRAVRQFVSEALMRRCLIKREMLTAWGVYVIPVFGVCRCPEYGNDRTSTLTSLRSYNGFYEKDPQERVNCSYDFVVLCKKDRSGGPVFCGTIVGLEKGSRNNDRIYDEADIGVS